MTDVAEFMTIADLNEALGQVGLSTNDVVRGSQAEGRLPGMYIDSTVGTGVDGTNQLRLVLVVTTYAKNENGRRYLTQDQDSVAATETRRYYIGGLGPLKPCTDISWSEVDE